MVTIQWNAVHITPLDRCFGQAELVHAPGLGAVTRMTKCNQVRQSPHRSAFVYRNPVIDVCGMTSAARTQRIESQHRQADLLPASSRVRPHRHQAPPMLMTFQSWRLPLPFSSWQAMVNSLIGLIRGLRYFSRVITFLVPSKTTSISPNP